MSRTGVLLAAHGSRRDPEVNARVNHLARTLYHRGAADVVEAGFHQGTPTYGEALDRLAADRVLVVPLFTSEGYYTTTALPQALQREPQRDSAVRYAPALGTNPALAALIGDRVAQLLSRYSLQRDSTAILIVGHGTRRNPESRGTTTRLADQLASLHLVAEVRPAFLDDDPEIEQVAASLTQAAVLVIPFLIGGAHATIDLPRRLGLAEVRTDGDVQLGEIARQLVLLDGPIGNYEGLADLLHHLVERELPARQIGSVSLVGAGPGDPGLITVRGLELLRSAEVILHDRLAPPELLAQARPDALVIDVGKAVGGPATAQAEINQALVAHARRGRKVVRLKGGDPFVFGRGAEEMDACEAAGIPCTVVPGVTSAIAVPAAAGIPVTARGEARSFAVVTARTERGLCHKLEEFSGDIPAVDTLVVLMGHARLAEFAAELVTAGRSPDTPVACIQEGTTARQRQVSGTLATIGELALREGLSAPLVTVIGRVAARVSRRKVPC